MNHCFRINTYFSGPTGQGSEELFGIFAFPKERPPKPDGLMKQTFSAWVLNPSTGHRVKWHMSVSGVPILSVLIARECPNITIPFQAYLSRIKGAELPTVQDDPVLRSMQAPAGIFECCTGPRKHRKPFANFQEGETGSPSVRQVNDDPTSSRRHPAPPGSDLIGPRSRPQGGKYSHSSLTTSNLTPFSLPSPPSSPTWNMKPLSSSQEDLSNRIVHLNGSYSSNPHTSLSHPPKDGVIPESWMTGQLTPISTPRPSMPPEGHETLSLIRTRPPLHTYPQRGISPTQSSNHAREYQTNTPMDSYGAMDGPEADWPPSHYPAQENLVYSSYGSSLTPGSISTPISYAPRTAVDREALASFGQIF